MASKAAENANICSVGLETRPLKNAGRCKHSFCTECLTTAIGTTDGDVFSSPTCQADCPRPWDGIEGLVDFTGEAMTAVELEPLMEKEGRIERKDEVVESAPGDEGGEKEIKREDVDDKCLICRHRKKDVQAVNLCAECNNLHICQDCTDVHARNKATQGHVVIHLLPEGKQPEAMCKKHDSAWDMYCQECKQAVCVVCVMLEHGDHTMDKLSNVVDANVEALKSILEDREKMLKKLQILEEDLILLTRIAPVVDKQDVLIKEIEEHAQKCIDRIVKWKEDLKGQVKADYQIIHDIPECLKKVSERVQKHRAPIQRAGGILAVPEYQPVYLHRLMALKQDFEALAERDDDVQGADYMDQVQELHNNDCSFIPVEILHSFGEIDKVQDIPGEFEPQEIFTLTMPVDSNKKFIPCVADLGQRFAVAHPTREGEPSDAIDIYDFPGKLIQTFKDHVSPLHDMSATPDGKLAVLSDGTDGTSRCVKLFDSETGYISSTRDVDIAKPLSLGVTLRHQYVILGDNEQGERQITVVDKDGQVEHTHVIKEKIEEKQIKPTMITCGGRLFYVIGRLGCFVYVIVSTGIQGVGCCFSFKSDDIHGFDIASNVWDDWFYTCTVRNDLMLGKRIISGRELKFKMTVLKKHMDMTEANTEIRVSTRSSHIVVSNGQTIRVQTIGI